MMRGVPLETCWAFTERLNNKFYYKVASFWLFLLSHTTMQGSINNKFVNAKRPQKYTSIGTPKENRTKRTQTSGLTRLAEINEFPLRLDYGRSPHTYVNHRLQIQLELLMMSVIPLETCWAFNEWLNNKIYYKVAYFWLFLLSLTTMHGFMNIKF
jgi:hypothetical protein